jgi:hypothetical protein
MIFVTGGCPLGSMEAEHEKMAMVIVEQGLLYFVI